MKKILVIIFLFFSNSLSADFPPAVHYAFGNYLGSGVYEVSGEQAFLMRLPFAYKFQEDGEGLRLRLPVNIGIYNWSATDGEAPDSINVGSFIPGIEYRHRVNERFSVEPFFDLGYAHDFDNSENTLVTAIGSAFKYQFGDQLQHWWVNRLTYAKARSEDDNAESTLTFWQTGIDLETPLEGSFFDYDFNLATYAMTRVYFDNFSLEADDPEKDVDVRQTYEGGLSFKLKEKWKFKFLEVGRVGFGYQFGDGFDLYKVFINLAI
ncbi:hypothetical protein PQO01_03790 [Lentisphaera marina]|uniref:hypothetical protein n=1 Tax=Lentisphaera marina TaxID=1111041 RepID=UPI0023665C82|nr:hypothetical protein [Lentisphaera marina]MDD7984072.1 hypothetical protein [Lentisphaera marina]